MHAGTQIPDHTPSGIHLPSGVCLDDMVIRPQPERVRNPGLKPQSQQSRYKTTQTKTTDTVTGWQTLRRLCGNHNLSGENQDPCVAGASKENSQVSLVPEGEPLLSVTGQLDPPIPHMIFCMQVTD